MANQAKPKSLVRSHIFPVRLSDLELETIRSKAKQAGISASALMRCNALMRPLPQRLSKVSLATYLELAHIGNNLNQLAKAVNLALKVGQPMPENWQEVEPLSKILQELRQELASSNANTVVQDLDESEEINDRETD